MGSPPGGHHLPFLPMGRRSPCGPARLGRRPKLHKTTTRTPADSASHAAAWQAHLDHTRTKGLHELQLELILRIMFDSPFLFGGQAATHPDSCETNGGLSWNPGPGDSPGTATLGPRLACKHWHTVRTSLHGVLTDQQGVRKCDQRRLGRVDPQMCLARRLLPEQLTLAIRHAHVPPAACAGRAFRRDIQARSPVGARLRPAETQAALACGAAFCWPGKREEALWPGWPAIRGLSLAGVPDTTQSVKSSEDRSPSDSRSPRRCAPPTGNGPRKAFRREVSLESAPGLRGVAGLHTSESLRRHVGELRLVLKQARRSAAVHVRSCMYPDA